VKIFHVREKDANGGTESDSIRRSEMEGESKEPFETQGQMLPLSFF